MTQVYSPWPLFSDDLEFAQSWMRTQLSRFPMTSEAGHTALNIGLRDELEKHLASHPKNEQDEQCSNDQFRFRLARIDGVRNPYRELIPSFHQSNACSFVADAAYSSEPLAVRLSGGLGDQLELLSLVLTWGERHNVPLRLLAEEKCCLLLEELLPEYASIEKFDPDSYPAFAQGMAVRFGIFEHDPTCHYTAWIKAAKLTADPNRVLCCWRAEGRGSSLSAHSRSIPFHLIHNFYLRHIEKEPTIKFTDITKWRPWEAIQLQKLGVIIEDPIRLGLTGLVELCRGKRVFSIDTALIHLCAAMGHRAHLLLPHFPDERWFELNHPRNNYGQYVYFHHSPHFGSWKSVLDSLS